MSTFVHGGNVAANGIRQHYLRYGGTRHADKPALILIPGITSPAITWGFVAEHLGLHLDTYVLDARGRGLSSTGPDLDYSVDTCADDISAFAVAMGIDSYHLVGHSMGARFVARASVRHPEGVKSVVLIDPPVSGPGRREYPSKLPWYVDSIRQSQRGMSAQDMRAFCPTWNDEQLQLRAEWLHTCFEPAIVRAFNDFHEVDFHQDLPNLPAPALLIVATRGGVIQAQDEEEIRQLQPSILIERVEDAGHMIPWDNLPGFLAAFGVFLGTELS